MLTTVLKNWKTSLIGIVAGAMLAASSVYKPGMTWKDWGAAVAVALLGLVAGDGTKA
jgi:hypothetical protein